MLIRKIIPTMNVNMESKLNKSTKNFNKEKSN
jgi:hypothetical protein